MSKRAAELLGEALKLAPPGRAELASELIASLDAGSDVDVDGSWASEIEERAARARAGIDPGEPWPEARDRLERDIRSR